MSTTGRSAWEEGLVWLVWSQLRNTKLIQSLLMHCRTYTNRHKELLPKLYEYAFWMQLMFLYPSTSDWNYGDSCKRTSLAVWDIGNIRHRIFVAKNARIIIRFRTAQSKRKFQGAQIRTSHCVWLHLHFLSCLSAFTAHKVYYLCTFSLTTICN